MAALPRRLRLVVLLLTFGLGALLFLWRLGSSGLVDETPPLFAASARAMVERGDWLIPHVNGLPRYDKPPLVYWLMGLLYALPGQARWDPLGTWASSLPSALATILVMLALADTLLRWPQPPLNRSRAARRSRVASPAWPDAGPPPAMGSPAAVGAHSSAKAPPILPPQPGASAQPGGLAQPGVMAQPVGMGQPGVMPQPVQTTLTGAMAQPRAMAQPPAMSPAEIRRAALTALTAPLAFALSPLVLLWGRIPVSDALFTAMVAVTALAFWRRLADPSQPWSLPWLLLGLAVLTKGPVAVVLLALLLALFLSLQQEARLLLRRLRPLAGLPLTALVALPWYGLALWRDGRAFWDSFIGYHNLQRFTAVVNDHLEPWWYFGPVLLVAALPLTPLLLLALARAIGPLRWRRWRGLPVPAAGISMPPEQSLARFAACWLLAILLFFTAAATKLPSYWLPATPAAALLVALIAQQPWGAVRSKARDDDSAELADAPTAPPATASATGATGATAAQPHGSASSRGASATAMPLEAAAAGSAQVVTPLAAAGSAGPPAAAAGFPGGVVVDPAMAGDAAADDATTGAVMGALTAEPALAGRSARSDRRLRDDRLPDRAFQVAWWLSLGLAALLALAFTLAPLWVPRIFDPEMPTLPAELLASGLLRRAAWLWALAVLLGWWLRARPAPLRLLALQLPLVLFVPAALLPSWALGDRLRGLPVRQIAAAASRLAAPREPLAMVGILKPSLHYYSGRVVIYEGIEPEGLVNLADRLRHERRPGMHPAPPAQLPSVLVVIDRTTAAEPFWQDLQPRELSRAGLYRLWRLNRTRLERRAAELRAAGHPLTWTRPRPERY